ncbi:hypothetical protein RRG08_065848 [Elysia crispata]|uniref:Uncharacterized protein n=1 Tax=Elysia crispata TaxID=231223 RepID=A0AAE0ZBD5_9GAST|nr:hypothetical protein RRG08_065848 [Elysia crispata]
MLPDSASAIAKVSGSWKEILNLFLSKPISSNLASYSDLNSAEVIKKTRGSEQHRDSRAAGGGRRTRE